MMMMHTDFYLYKIRKKKCVYTYTKGKESRFIQQVVERRKDVKR